MGRVPDNPAAWLRASARNRALDLLRRQRTRTRLLPDVSRLQDELAPAVDAAFTDDALREEQLRMMFACCDARLQPPVQVALVLKLLCGFGVGEVAQAFLASPAAIEKRLARGKAALRRSGALGDLADPRLARRLEAVLDALYDALYAQRPTPVVALNRAIAMAQIQGPERGLLELQALPGRDRLARYPFYPAALGELHLRAGHAREAAEEFRRALRLARSPAERSYFQRKLAAAT